jgi:hypothetical protein
MGWGTSHCQTLPDAYSPLGKRTKKLVQEIARLVERIEQPTQLLISLHLCP